MERRGVTAMVGFYDMLQPQQMGMMPPQPAAMQNGMMPQMAQSDPFSLQADQGYNLGDPKTLASRIQESLGAKQPDQGGAIKDILAGRFEQEQPSFNDIGSAAQQTFFNTLNGKAPVSGQQYADTRMENTMTKLLALRKLKENAGGATGELVDRYMAASPGMSFPEALYSVQTGMRQGLMRDPVTGALMPIPGGPQSKGIYAHSEHLSGETGTQEAKRTWEPGTAGEVQAAKNTQDIEAIPEKAIAEKTGQQIIGLPVIEQNTAYAKKLISDLVKHPGLSSATGMNSYLPVVRGTDRADFEGRKNQINGIAFLQAFSTLRGGGQISNTEGDKATAAIIRLNTPGLKQKDFIAAANELDNILNVGLKRARSEASGNFNQSFNSEDFGNSALPLDNNPAMRLPGAAPKITPEQAIQELKRRGKM